MGASLFGNLLRRPAEGGLAMAGLSDGADATVLDFEFTKIWNEAFALDAAPTWRWAMCGSTERT